MSLQKRIHDLYNRRLGPPTMFMLFCLVLESLLDLEYLPLSEEQNVTTPPQRPSPISKSLILILTITHRPRLAAASVHQ